MAESGRVRGAKNVESFEKFVSNHNRENDWVIYINPGGKQLNKVKVSDDCGFKRFAFYQNELLKEKLEDLESNLRQSGILVAEHSQKSMEFDHPNQEVLIKSYEDKVMLYKANAKMLDELLDQYSKKLNGLK